ncbi:hypothetical protein EMCG_06530 [[Emmonsia] crescens]|uniref:DUF1996 domain-containing protein n=1 Tax=[Emmonsia] crescens TaxID=73230 RepID=A0A0G2IBZ8_9EURO|nr:hypothetical protein EMCG_06530 [Emmonsia crescens UAMH 3008]
MLAGDTYRRNFTLPVPDPPKSSWFKEDTAEFALQQKALGFNCMNYALDPEPSLYRHTLPNKEYLDAYCTDGLRTEIMFPSCWNGRDLDTPDHKSHVAYPSTVDDGTCPHGFGTRLISLYYETIWNTNGFRGVEGEFTFANGDPTGCGYHADFIEAWEDSILQKAAYQCMNMSGRVEDCPLFILQPQEMQEHCKLRLPEVLTHEQCQIHYNGLPGNVSIIHGPEYAKDKP